MSTVMTPVHYCGCHISEALASNHYERFPRVTHYDYSSSSFVEGADFGPRARFATMLTHHWTKVVPQSTCVALLQHNMFIQPTVRGLLKSHSSTVRNTSLQQCQARSETTCNIHHSPEHPQTCFAYKSRMKDAPVWMVVQKVDFMITCRWEVRQKLQIHHPWAMRCLNYSK